MAIFPASAIPSAAADFDIPYSCRFNAVQDSTGAYLSRTAAGDGNRKTWTYSAWIKRGLIERQYLLSSVVSGGSAGAFYLAFDDTASGTTLGIGSWEGTQLYTTAKYRDPNAWMHIVLSWDTTQTTDTNRAQLYVNGSLVALNENTGAGGWAGYPGEDDERYINSTVAHAISGTVPYADDRDMFDGHMAEIHLIDGTSFFSADDGTANTSFNINTFGETGA